MTVIPIINSMEHTSVGAIHMVSSIAIKHILLFGNINRVDGILIIVIDLMDITLGRY